jgi:hypothetical protein
MQITVDTYGHLIPGADIAWVDRLDAPVSAQESANRTQTPSATEYQPEMEVVEKNWLPPRDSNPDMLIQSQCYADSEFPGFCLKNQLLTSRISPHGSALAK